MHSKLWEEIAYPLKFVHEQNKLITFFRMDVIIYS